MLTVGSLFSGIGGLELGLERVGMAIKWQVEIDPFCNRVLEKHWPEVKRYGDIKGINWEEVESVDLVCGGFPCPSVSIAGRRKGNDDERWLWPEFLRCIRKIRPKWILAENVFGLLSVHAGREFTEILRDLSQAGYDAEWLTVKASDLGAPHRRERVFIVAHANKLHDDPAGHGTGSVRGELEEAPKIQECEMALPEGGEHDGSGDSRGWRPGPSNSCVPMEHPIDRGCQGEALHIRPWRQETSPPVFRGSGMGDPYVKGLEIRQLPEVGPGDIREERPAPWPPGPEDREGWAKVLERWPELAPALVYPNMRGHRRKANPELPARVDKAGKDAGGQSQTESPVRNLADELSAKLVRRNRIKILKALGNAVVPAVAEVIGRLILEANDRPLVPESEWERVE
jgi:site-specific DNA-cytosine methylase